MSGQMDVKREEFWKYLEKEGVLEYLTKQLVSGIITRSVGILTV